MSADLHTAGGEVLYSSTGAGGDMDRLYALCDELMAAGDKAAEHEAAFTELLGLVQRGDTRIKQMGLPTITRVAASFSGQTDQFINAVLDCLESEDTGVRQAGLRALVKVASAETAAAKVAHVMTQLLSSEDAKEAEQAAAGLDAAVDTDPAGALVAVLRQARTDDEAQSKKAIAYVTDKLRLPRVARKLSEQGEAAEEKVAAQLREALAAATDEQAYRKLFQAVSRLRSMSSAEGMGEQMRLLLSRLAPGDLNVADAASVGRVQTLLWLVVPLLNKGAPAAELLDVLTNRVLPRVGGLSDQDQVALLKQVAQIVRSKAVDAPAALLLLPTALALLRDRLALVADPTAAADAAASAAVASAVPAGEALAAAAPAPAAPAVNFAALEALLLAFHTLASRNKTALPALCGLRATPFTGQPSDMVSADKAKQADELRAKLRTLSQASTAVQDKLKAVAKAAGGTPAEKRERQQSVSAATRAAANVHTLATALVRTPVADLKGGEGGITPSWMPAKKEAGDAAGKQQQQQQQQQQQGGKKGAAGAGKKQQQQQAGGKWARGDGAAAAAAAPDSQRGTKRKGQGGGAAAASAAPAPAGGGQGNKRRRTGGGAGGGGAAPAPAPAARGGGGGGGSRRGRNRRGRGN